MSSIKCPSCGHRNLYSTVLRICSNCGATLSSPVAGSDASSDISSPPHLPALAPSDQSSQKSTVVQPYQRSMPAPLSMSARSMQLYQAAEHPVSVDLEDEGPFQTIIQETEEPVPPLPLLVNRLPRGLPRRPAEITGQLIYVQSQTYHSATPNLAGSIVKQLFSFVLPESAEHQNREREKVITRMRVRSADDTQSDAYLEGMLTGANVALGDNVSLWGRKRKGTLIVQRAYNHTTRSIVTSNATNSQGSMVGLLVLFLIVFLILTLGFHVQLLPHLP